MHEHKRDMPRPGSETADGGRAESPVGEIDLGRPPSIGRRARLLAGLAIGSAAVVLLTPGTPETGTSHSEPWMLG